MSESVLPFEPGEALELADAIAHRAGQLTVVSSQIAAGLQGKTYEAPNPEELHQTHLSRAVLYLAQVEDPERPIRWAQELTASPPEVTQGVQILNAADEDEVNRSLALDLFDEYQSASGETDEKLARDFKNLLIAARGVATERNISIASVYTADEHYYEARKRATTPERLAQTISRQVEGMSPEVLTGFLLKNLETIVPPEELEGLEPDVLFQIALELQMDPATQAAINNSTEVFREVVRQRGIYLFSRIFGVEVLDNLPETQRQLIIPKRPSPVDIYNRLSRPF